MSDLLAEINQHYHNHGRYPKVYVRQSFFMIHEGGLRKLVHDGIKLTVKKDYSQPEDWRLE